MARLHSSRSLLGRLGALARPSSFVRALWLVVALLHVWLIVRRFVFGDWSSAMDFIRGGLCLAAVWYTSLKFWRISTIFDSNPRRILAFALLMVVGHFLVQAPDASGAAAFEWLHQPAVVVVTAAPLLTLVVALGAGFAWLLAVRESLGARRAFAHAGDLRTATSFSRHYPPLHRRPPPVLA